MHKRKLVIALATAGLLSAGFGASILPASADPQAFLVTLRGGAQRTVTLDVPAGGRPDPSSVPGIDPSQIESITPLSSPAPATTTPAQTQTTQTQTQTQTTQTQTTQTQPTATTPAPPAQTTPAPPAQSAPQQPAPAQTTPTTTTVQPRKHEPTRKAAAKRPAAKHGEHKGDQKDTTAKPQAQVQDPAPTEPAAPATPAPATPDPTQGLAPSAVGVPNFFIDHFRIPPFLLPIYEAAGTQYGVRWEVLAAINEIETDYGRNLNISTAGALGWMQFMPSTWSKYGVDANLDHKRDPFNPVDAIFAAARYLKAAGADKDVRRAVWAYNHADWYVDDVLRRAQGIAGIPSDLVSSLSGLTQGHFPVAAHADYDDAVTASKTVHAGQNAANPVESDTTRTGIDIRARAGSPVIAVTDGQIVSVGRSTRLGTYVTLRDAYGNTYTYGHLKKASTVVPVPKAHRQSAASVKHELGLDHKDPAPTQPATAGRQQRTSAAAPAKKATTQAPQSKERLFANPRRPASWAAGGRTQLGDGGSSELPADATMARYFTIDYGLDRNDVSLRPLVKGRKVIAGTILGRVGTIEPGRKPWMRFEVRPAGKGAPRIDPKPILDGWKLLESTDVYRAADKGVLASAGAQDPTVGQLLLMSKEELQRRVLDDKRIQIYSCGRRDIEAGIIDRRVLATLVFLTANGLNPTVSSMRCGHSYMTASGNVSEHSAGSAVDIAAINGTPIIGHQGAGTITDTTIRKLLTLQGAMQPHQIISLMKYPNAANTLALPDHFDHIHVGFRPTYDPNSKSAAKLNSALKPGQWSKLIERLGSIDNPTVSTKPSKYALDGTG